MAKENEALYDFRLGIKNFKGYQEICYTSKKIQFLQCTGLPQSGKSKKKNLHGRVKVTKFCDTQGKICQAVSEKSENFYLLVHSSPVSFIQDCKTSSLVAFYI